MKQHVLAAATAILLVASAPASAADAVIDVGGTLQLSLIDLDPNDGITPWISYVATLPGDVDFVTRDSSGFVLTIPGDGLFRYDTAFWMSPNTEAVLTGAVHEKLAVPDPLGMGLIHVHATLGSGQYLADPRFDFLTVVRQHHSLFDIDETRAVDLSYVNPTDARQAGVFVFGMQTALVATHLPELENSTAMLAALLLFGAGAIRSRRARS